MDFDSQANLTTCYGIEDTGALEYTIGHLMMAQIEEELPENFEDYIQSREGVDYIPSSIYLSVVDAKLRTEMGAERMLAEVLEPLRSRYDYILIDTCPALGMLTINALAAADEVIITVNPQLLAMMGLQDFLRTVGKIKKYSNHKLCFGLFIKCNSIFYHIHIQHNSAVIDFLVKMVFFPYEVRNREFR